MKTLYQEFTRGQSTKTNPHRKCMEKIADFKNSLNNNCMERFKLHHIWRS